MPVAGVHLMPFLEEIDGPRRSAVAVIGDDDALIDLRLAAGDEEVLEAVPPGTAVACVDAPLAVPAERGRRDVERVLAWCDVPAFPVSAERMRKVYGGARGVRLRPGLLTRAARVLEALPALVLRQLMWERAHGDAPMDLGEYRTRWIAVRPPVPARRRAGGSGAAPLLQAHALVASVLDLGGWAPVADGDERRARHDSARLDAVLAAYAALRVRRDRAVVLGTPARGEVAVPADANLRARIEATLARMRAEGAIHI